MNFNTKAETKQYDPSNLTSAPQVEATVFRANESLDAVNGTINGTMNGTATEDKYVRSLINSEGTNVMGKGHGVSCTVQASSSYPFWSRTSLRIE